jgi:hypothetical protein
MTNLHGDGTQGKRLWMRSPDKRWIEVPVGAGQDPKVRSVNVWDGKQWITPTWGYLRWEEEGQYTEQIDSFDVHAPGVTWNAFTFEDQPNGLYNPNLWTKDSGGTSYGTDHDGWLKLAPMWPRTSFRRDPNWRIVSLTRRIPMFPPTRTVELATDVGLASFFPSVGYLRDATGYTPPPGGGTITSGPFAKTSEETALELGSYTNISVDPTLAINDDSAKGVLRVACTIDLKAIRQRVHDEYPQRGIDYVGQYELFSLMSVRRIVLNGTFNAALQFIGPEVDNDGLFAGATATGYYQINGATGTEVFSDANFDISAPIRYPLTSGPQGAPLVQTPFVRSRYAAYAFDPNRDVSRYVLGANPPAPINTFTVLDQVGNDDSITFSVDFANLPLPAKNGVDVWQASIEWVSGSVSIHYAMPGYDTPPESYDEFLAPRWIR